MGWLFFDDRAYIEKDNNAMKDKMSQEEEERKRKEREIAEKLAEQESARENEIIQLYKKMANENRLREQEIEGDNNKAWGTVVKALPWVWGFAPR